MKKSTLLLPLFSAIFLSGCIGGQTNITIDSTQPEAKQIAQGAKLAQIIEQGGKASCSITNQENPEESTQMLVSGMKMKIIGNNIADGKKGYMLNDGVYTYIWSEGEKQGFKTKNPEVETETDTDQPTGQVPQAKSSTEMAAEYEDETKYKIDCQVGSVSDSEFVPPADVVFTDPSEMMKNLPSIKGSN